METAVLIEVERLRRASLSDLRQKYWEVFQEVSGRVPELAPVESGDQSIAQISRLMALAIRF